MEKIDFKEKVKCGRCDAGKCFYKAEYQREKIYSFSSEIRGCSDCKHYLNGENYCEQLLIRVKRNFFCRYYEGKNEK